MWTCYENIAEREPTKQGETPNPTPSDEVETLTQWSVTVRICTCAIGVSSYRQDQSEPEFPAKDGNPALSGRQREDHEEVDPEEEVAPTATNPQLPATVPEEPKSPWTDRLRRQSQRSA